MCCGVPSTNAARAAVPCLLICRWYSTSDLHKFVTNGGFPKLPASLVAKTLRGMPAIPSFKRYKTKNVLFYCFDIGNSFNDSPRSQYLVEVRTLSQLIIPPKFFMDNKVWSNNLLDKMRLLHFGRALQTSARTTVWDVGTYRYLHCCLPTGGRPSTLYQHLLWSFPSFLPIQVAGRFLPASNRYENCWYWCQRGMVPLSSRTCNYL